VVTAVDSCAVPELQQQLLAQQERFALAEVSRLKEAHATAAEHSEALHRLHHKLAATEIQVNGSLILLVARCFGYHVTVCAG
jgi:hypothetical protein